MHTETTIPFVKFPKMARLSREVIITEKLDGTNASITIGETPDPGAVPSNAIAHWILDGRDLMIRYMLAGSRTRWITPEQDNYGFARWAKANAEELSKLGTGTHFGEWWGKGIQRGYGLTEKRFSLFNVTRWRLHGSEPSSVPTADPRVARPQEELPACCSLVPVLWKGPFNIGMVWMYLDVLSNRGSFAAPGFMRPEGVVVFHTAAGICFKKTIEKDETPKSLAGVSH